ncbi:MAG TPA: GNAT family N-acetyltransferase [Kiloniellales bacterium]|nr:GNAT family N-acetyltransferase [Kiloniellales bacterium]
MAHEAFIARHFPALERDFARHNLILGSIEAERDLAEPNIATWSLGAPGACAIHFPGQSLILGDLDRAQCARLAEETLSLHPEGIGGPEETAAWYVERAVELGKRYRPPVAQAILALTGPPRHPSVPGTPRRAAPEDALLVADWILAFYREAVVDERPPERDELQRSVARGQHFLWIARGRPVAVARIARRAGRGGAIAPVYTLPEARNQGFGAAITAHLCERLLAEGRGTVALYVDRGNAAAIRCYAKLGFRMNCASLHYARDRGS